MANYQATGGIYGRRDKKITATTATTVVDGANALALVSITCTEHAGGTPNLTIAIVNTAAETIYLRNAVAMTAKERVTIDIGWPLSGTDLVKVTSSIADNVDVMAVVIERAPAQG